MFHVALLNDTQEMATKSVTKEVGDFESFRGLELKFHKDIEIILSSSYNS